MAKIVTIRLSEDEYLRISSSARNEHRPISNFITAVVMKTIEESFHVDAIEMAQIKSDRKLLKDLRAGHADAVRMRGKFVD